jgi:hypothetical protein
MVHVQVGNAYEVSQVMEDPDSGHTKYKPWKKFVMWSTDTKSMY